MTNVAQVLAAPKNRIEEMAKGDDKKDPDIIAFAFASVFAVAMAVTALGLSFFFWRNAPDVLFAAPSFPQMGNCSAVEQYALAPRIPPVEGTDPSILALYLPPNAELGTPETEAALDRMVAECRYNFELNAAYHNLQNWMSHVPVEEAGDVTRADTDKRYSNDLTQSLEGLLKVFCVAASLLGMYVLWVLERMQGNRIDFDKHFNRSSWENRLLAVVLAVLTYVGIDVLWFFIERSLSQPLVYGTGTSILFIGVLTGVFSFLYFSWIIKLEITDLSLFMGLMLVVGLIVGMLLTNHIWDVGVTNAYSTMSERAYPERLAYEVAGTLGSRGIFRVTFIMAGLLFVVYGVRLKRIVGTVKTAINEHGRADSSQMSPNWVLNLSLIAGILMALVGIFPLDGLVGSKGLDYFYGFNPGLSSSVHLLGAYGSPLCVMCMILSFWYIGYPKGNGKDEFLPASSYFWFSVSATAIMWHLVGRYLGAPENLKSLGFAAGFALFVILAVYIANFFQTKKLNLYWSENTKYSPFFHWFVALALGITLGFFLPDKMTTVSLEFVVLLVFSLFIYSYSKYIVEYEEEKASSTVDNPSPISELRNVA